MSTAPRTVISIVGTARGGTHIVARVLAAVPGIAYGAEFTGVWANAVLRPGAVCACGLPSAECPQWRPVIEATGPRAAEIVALQRRLTPGRHGWRNSLATQRRVTQGRLLPDERAYLDVLEQSYATFLDQTRCTALVDVSKKTTEAALLTNARELQPFVVHVVRDPRGVLQSRLDRRGGGGALRAAAKVSMAWNAQHLAAERLGQTLGDRYFRVHYEDFARDPQTTVRSVLDRLGHPYDSLPDTDGGHTATVFHNPAPQVPGGRQSIAVRLDERWREDLATMPRMVTSVLTAAGRAHLGRTLAEGVAPSAVSHRELAEVVA
jgi:hypothetical protein